MRNLLHIAKKYVVWKGTKLVMLVWKGRKTSYINLLRITVMPVWKFFCVTVMRN